jgi:hypothetical protein
VYTALLLIAFIGLVLGIVALYFEMADYKFEFRRAPTPAVSALDLRPEKVPGTFWGTSDGLFA